MWIYNARIQYGEIDNECSSSMTADKDIERRLNEYRRKMVKRTES